MVNLCVFILGILSVIYAIPSNKQVCLTVIPIKNYILIRQRYKVLYDKNFGSCTYACELNSVCHSSNYYFKTRMCELNKSPADGWQKRSLVAHESAVFTLNPHKISCQHAGCVDGVCSSQTPGQVQEMFTCSCQHLIQSGKSCQGKKRYNANSTLQSLNKPKQKNDGCFKSRIVVLLDNFRVFAIF